MRFTSAPAWVRLRAIISAPHHHNNTALRSLLPACVDFYQMLGCKSAGPTILHGARPLLNQGRVPMAVPPAVAAAATSKTSGFADVVAASEVAKVRCVNSERSITMRGAACILQTARCRFAAGGRQHCTHGHMRNHCRCVAMVDVLRNCQLFCCTDFRLQLQPASVCRGPNCAWTRT